MTAQRLGLRQRRKTQGLSQEGLAQILNVDRSTVVRWERGENEPQPWHRPKLAEALQVSLDELAALLSSTPLDRIAADDLAIRAGEEQDGAVNRRSFLPLTMAPAALSLNGVAAPLTPFARPDTPESTLTIERANQLTRQAKQLYQACRYQQSLTLLPTLIDGLHQLEQSSQQQPAAVLLADAYHVLAGILLKLGDTVLATLAASRALEAAQRGGDLISVACSARSMTHALMSSGHAERAVTLAGQAADSLRRSKPEWDTSAGLSAYGALVLRAAVAAARQGDQSTSNALLTDADTAAARLGHDANDRWTGFGPANVDIHKVHNALTLGNAGQALSLAKTIDPRRIQLTERRASLLTDVTRAYLALGRPSSALPALQSAYRIAPQEIRERPAGHRLCRDLVAMSRGPLRDASIRFAMQAGLIHVA